MSLKEICVPHKVHANLLADEGHVSLLKGEAFIIRHVFCVLHDKDPTVLAISLQRDAFGLLGRVRSCSFDGCGRHHVGRGLRLARVALRSSYHTPCRGIEGPALGLCLVLDVRFQGGQCRGVDSLCIHDKNGGLA